MSQKTPSLDGLNPRVMFSKDECVALKIGPTFANVAVKDYCSEKLIDKAFVAAHGVMFGHQEALDVLKSSLNIVSIKHKHLDRYIKDAMKYYKAENTVNSFKDAFEYQCNEIKIQELKTLSSYKGLRNALAITLKEHDYYCCINRCNINKLR